MIEPSAPASELHTTVAEIDGRQVVTLAGDLDAHAAVWLRQELIALIEDGGTSIVFDLADLEFVDSTGLGVLVGAEKRLRQRGGELVIRSPRASARKVFELTGLDRVFAIEGQRARSSAELVGDPGGRRPDDDGDLL